MAQVHPNATQNIGFQPQPPNQQLQQSGYYSQQANMPPLAPNQQIQQAGYYPQQPANMPPPPPGAPIQWMQRPNPINGVAPGLEYLHQIDKLNVEQKVDLLEAFTGWEESNRYVIKNAVGQQVYYAFEKSETCMRQCCGPNRGFTIHIVDNFNQEVLRISREFKCCAAFCCFSGCCDCSSHIVKVESVNGQQVLGYIKQKWSFVKPRFQILDETQNPIFDIDGPCCVVDGPFCPCDVEFKVNDLKDGKEIGKISKEFSGFVKESYTTADNFNINFPLSIPVNAKASFIGALFLIDFMYFEKNESQENQNHHRRRHHHHHY